ncbi:MAG: prephenate dehydrogenase/arogenate dehydrogenase family protein [Muribaculaceae bacterium]|nr:prephenate dehydrogenase/arogenate dehydrogenase family protein [Muribaculaceae bacterium]
MKILILGAGKMGKFFCDLLSDRGHEMAIFDIDPRRLLYTFNCRRFGTPEEIEEFRPDLVINAATVKYTIPAFERVMAYLPEGAMLSDIASVKTGLPEYYASCGHRFVSTHPMFGPTFASLSNLSNENAIIISEGDAAGREFFRDLYESLGLNIADYTFAEHDLTTSYTLSLPFVSTFLFVEGMDRQDVPGTTFNRHLAIARGLLGEDDFLLQEILFNPNTPARLEEMARALDRLRHLIAARDAEGLRAHLSHLRAILSSQPGH